MAEYQKVSHGFAPVYDSFSQCLILGSFPSVKSREEAFYYGHPRNRFWKVMAAVLHTKEPGTVEEKKQMLLSHHIALYDVIEQCEIIGSSDSSIRNVVPADLSAIIAASAVDRVYVNGQTAGKLYHRYQEKQLQIPAVQLPSTSPANAACSLEKLIEIWKNNMIL